MSRYKTSDTLDLKYRMESLEKRIDNIERLLFSLQQSSFGNGQGNGGINNELFMLLIDMIKKDVRNTPTQPQGESSSDASTGKITLKVNPDEVQCTNSDNLSSFDMARRRSIL